MLHRRFRTLTLSILASLIIAISAFAQTPISPIPPSNQQPIPKTSATGSAIPAVTQSRDQNYRVGPGDVLDVRVFNQAQLSGERRVDEVGRIRMPFIADLQAACLTEAELAQQITEKLKRILRDPQVDVFVKEYKSLPVAVIGAVNQPARFQLQRRVRLLELLSQAGGPSNRAGGFVNIIHSNDYDFCQGNLGKNDSQPREAKPADSSSEPKDQADTISILTALSTISLRDLLAGKPDANMYVQPGDIVSVPEADQIYVTGAVNRPGAYALTTKITLTQAIGLAGGINMEGAKKVRLIRQEPNSDKRSEVVYNYGDITKRKIEDIALMPNDIIEVPNSVMRAASRNMLGVSISMLSALPYFIIR